MNLSLAGLSGCLGIVVQSLTPTFVQTSVAEGQRCLKTKIHYSMEHLPHVVVEHVPPPITAFARLSCQRDCAQGTEADHSISLHPVLGRLFVFVSCHFKCTTVTTMWMHVKAMYSACVNFFLCLKSIKGIHFRETN